LLVIAATSTGFRDGPRIDRLEVYVTDLTMRLQRMRSTGAYDTGAMGQLLGKPVLLKLFAEGIVGYGQIRPLAPHHSMSETYGSIITAITEVYGPKLLGQRIFDIEKITAEFDLAGPFNFNARAIIDHALYDACGKAVGQPVYNLIGGLCQERLPLEWSISMAADVGKMVADAQRAVDEFGIKVLCIKAGHPEGWRKDRQHLAAIREAVGDDIVVGLDPNTGWTVAETIQALEGMESYRVGYLEQPIDRNDLAGMAEIRRAAKGVPIMADEALGSIQDARRIVEARAADVLCIKLYKHGGITPARKIAAIAEAANIKINCGGLAVQSQLEAAAGAHFYASRPAKQVMPAAEFIFGLGILEPDPIVPETDFIIKDGHVTPPSGPGLGITVDDKALEACALRKDVLQ
jgi:L-alanine-DL-glutamate epimerase-like enolase superfamily enzyme